MATTKIDFTQIKTGLPAGGDVNYNDVTLLLNMEGSDGSNSFSDGSSSGHVITAGGSVAISTSQYKFGASSAYFNGTDSSLQIARDEASFNIAPAEDYTYEAWYYSAVQPAGYHVILNNFRDDQGYIGWSLLTHGNKFHFNLQGNYTDTASTWAANTWYHLAVVRSAGVATLYINGTADSNTVSYNGAVSSITGSGPWVGGSPEYAGGAGARWLTGYVDGVRVTKGLARYTSNFSVPTAAFPAFESKEGKRLVVNANESIELES